MDNQLTPLDLEDNKEYFIKFYYLNGYRDENNNEYNQINPRPIMQTKRNINLFIKVSRKVNDSINEIYFIRANMITK